MTSMKKFPVWRITFFCVDKMRILVFGSKGE